MRKTLIVFLAVVALIALAAWTVGRRTKGLMPTGMNPFAPTQSASSTGESGLPILADHMPEFSGITAWLNSGPLTPAQLKGKVVLVDFWTYSCINCIRTLPYVTSWQEKYGDKGFTVIGVHTPEFAFEKEEANVRDALARFHITYPVALDNAYGTWNNYSNHYWPAHYLFDAQGRLREEHFGEGAYAQTEKNIQALLKEAGHEADMSLTSPTSTTDLRKVGTPETYLGYGRQEYLGSPESVMKDTVGTYSVAKDPLLNRFYFGGEWVVGSERAVAGPEAKIVYRYSASQANLVMSGNGAKRRVEVLLDGTPVPKDLRGADVVEDGGKTYVEVEEERLYELTNAKSVYGKHLLELRFLDPGTAAYAFTFG